MSEDGTIFVVAALRNSGPGRSKGEIRNAFGLTNFDKKSPKEMAT